MEGGGMATTEGFDSDLIVDLVVGHVTGTE